MKLEADSIGPRGRPRIERSKRGVTGIEEGEEPDKRGQGAREEPNQIHSHLVGLGYKPISGPRDRIMSQAFCSISGGPTITPSSKYHRLRWGERAWISSNRRKS